MNIEFFLLNLSRSLYIETSYVLSVRLTQSFKEIIIYLVEGVVGISNVF